jgi:NADH-quinone oxidoreductase subunit L
MTVPLAVLALLTIVTGLAVGIPSAHGTPFARFLAPVFPVEKAEHSFLLIGLSVIVVLGGILLAAQMYLLRPVRPEALGQPSTPLRALLLNAYYIDALYDTLIVRPLHALSRWLARVFDLRVIDGAVNDIGRGVLEWARGLRVLQTGYLANYALTMLLGAVVLLAFLVAR